MGDQLAYIGFIKDIQPIADANKIVLATAVCGKGGIWRGIVPITMQEKDKVVVFQPDSQLPSDNPEYDFMSRYGYRVKQRRFKGVPSECLIMPASEGQIGEDVTIKYGVSKWVNPAQKHFNAEAEGNFPAFIPKTDEPNIQKVMDMVESMQGDNFYITLKMDGMSSTAYKKHGKFGVCSRNLEIKDGENAIWKIVHRYEVDKYLPEGMAVQFETCGPGIQGNPIGLKDIEGFAFQIWNHAEKRYLSCGEFLSIIPSIMPNVPILEIGNNFRYTLDQLQELAMKQVYPNGNPAEGIVVRPRQEKWGMFHSEMSRLSFKVINLVYNQ